MIDGPLHSVLCSWISPSILLAPIILAAVTASTLASPALAEPMCQMHLCDIVGTEGDDQLTGTQGDDVICGLGGNDVIKGKGGNDLLCGDAGNDILDGGRGDDILVGGPGVDSLRGRGGRNTMFDYQGDNAIGSASSDDAIMSTMSSKSTTSSDCTTCPKENSFEAQLLDSAPPGIQPSASSSSTIARFTTANHVIFAPDGSVFEPRGVNIFPWHLTSRDLDGIIDCWGFNMVRLHSWILPVMTNQWKDHLVFIDEPLIFDPGQTQFRTYDIAPLIEAYTAREIVVVVDIHDLIGKYFVGDNLANYLKFAEQLATKYKDNPYVWFDVHNEPGNWDGQNLDFTDWRTEMPLILDTVRAIAPKMMLMVSGAAWGQDTGPNWGHAFVNPAKSALLANSDIIQGYSNLITTFHMYDQWTFSLDRVRDFIDQLYAASDAPVLVGEYGSYNGNSTLTASQNLHELIRQTGYANVGRSVWNWSAYDQNDLVAVDDGSGYKVDSCAVPTNLTTLGQMVWDDNHGL